MGGQLPPFQLASWEMMGPMQGRIEVLEEPTPNGLA